MLDTDVLAILTEISGHEGRSRSWVINYIIRHYAQQMVAKEMEAVRRATATIPF